MFKLRDYQEAPVSVGASYFKDKTKKHPTLLVLPTAAGKSILIAHIVNQLDAKTLVLQPSKELLRQNHSKYTTLGGGASIYSASFNTKEFGNVTYATLGSIKNIGAQFQALGYKYLIVDEAHLYSRESDSIFKKFLKESKIKKVLGLTATPFKLHSGSTITGERYSKLTMLTTRTKSGTFYKEILHVTQIQELTAKNFWAKLEYEVYSFDTGLLEYNTTRADYTDESMRKAYHTQGIGDKITDKLEHLQDRKSIIVFVPSKEEAIYLAGITPNAAVVYSGMADKERDKIITGFKALEIRVIYNVNILSVGFDHPELDCIICGRPTLSLAWLYQAYGRGTRIHPNKKDCLIVDFVGNTSRFGRIEDLYFKHQNDRWCVFGTGGKLLTGIPLHEVGGVMDKDLALQEDKEIVFNFGSYKGKRVESAPEWYWSHVLRTHNFTPQETELREKLIRLKNLKPVN